jgi:hypothetical protein
MRTGFPRFTTAGIVGLNRNAYEKWITCIGFGGIGGDGRSAEKNVVFIIADDFLLPQRYVIDYVRFFTR